MLRSLLLLLITLHFGLGADELGSVYRPQHSRSFLVREKSLGSSTLLVPYSRISRADYDSPTSKSKDLVLDEHTTVDSPAIS